MTSRFLTPLKHSIVACAALMICLASATDASATCSSTNRQKLSTPARFQFGSPGLAAVQRLPPGPSDRIVGMWAAELRLNTGELYEQTLQLFHADGTEMQVSNGVPPVLGNVCVGVWTLTRMRTVKLRHLAWNWTAEGSVTGTYVLVATIDVDRRGNTYQGTWMADSFDLSGNVIPELRAEGVVTATRVTAD